MGLQPWKARAAIDSASGVVRQEQASSRWMLLSVSMIFTTCSHANWDREKVIGNSWGYWASTFLVFSRDWPKTDQMDVHFPLRNPINKEDA